MITSKAVHEECLKTDEVLKGLENDSSKDYQSSLLKMMQIQVKLLQNIRSNLVKSMRHAGIEVGQEKTKD